MTYRGSRIAVPFCETSLGRLTDNGIVRTPDFNRTGRRPFTWIRGYLFLMTLASFKKWFRSSRPARKYRSEPPLRTELFSAEQMTEHGKTLADSHKLSTDRA